MNSNAMYQQQILEELQNIPEKHTKALLRMIRDYKLNVISSNSQKQATPLYGIWKNKISDDIDEPLKEIREGWKKRLENVDV